MSVISLAIFVLLGIIAFMVFGRKVAEAMAVSYLCSLFFALIGFVSLAWAFNKSTKVFLSVVLGGMFLRFILLGAILFCILRFTNIHFVSFILSFVLFYFLLQLSEIKIVLRELSGN